MSWTVGAARHHKYPYRSAVAVTWLHKLPST